MSITIIEGMKLKKRLHKKADDLRDKIRRYSSHMSNENPVYTDQGARVKGWLQAHRDIVKKIAELSLNIQKTNLQTEVELQIGGTPVKKSIAEWILRRRELANMEQAAHAALSDGRLRDETILASDGHTKIELKVQRYFDPVERDTFVDTFKHEPSRIDAKLEVVNATTTLVEPFEFDEDKV